MKKIFTGIGESVIIILRWILFAVFMLAILGIAITTGIVAIGVITVFVIVFLIGAGIRKIFNFKWKDKTLTDELNVESNSN